MSTRTVICDLTVQELWSRIDWLSPEEAMRIGELSTWRTRTRDAVRDGAWELLSFSDRPDTPTTTRDVARTAGRSAIGSLTPNGSRTWLLTWDRTWGGLWDRTWAAAGLSPAARPDTPDGPWGGRFVELHAPWHAWQCAWEWAWDVAWDGSWAMSWLALSLAGSETADTSTLVIDGRAVSRPVLDVLDPGQGRRI